MVLKVLQEYGEITSSFSIRCGLRAGYVELVNIDPKVMKYIYTLFSKDSSAPVLGQIALDVMANPPQPGDPSYPLYHTVRLVRRLLAHRGIFFFVTHLQLLCVFFCRRLKTSET